MGVVPEVVGGTAIGTAVARFWTIRPSGTVIGSIGGGVMAGGPATRLTGFGLPSPEEMSPGTATLCVRGRVRRVRCAWACPAVPAAGFPLRHFRRSGNCSTRSVSPVRRAPVRFRSGRRVDGTSAASAATTAGVYSRATWARTDGRRTFVGGGHPAKLVRGAGEYTWNLTRNAVQSLSTEGRTTASAKLLADIAAKTGEDLG